MPHYDPCDNYDGAFDPKPNPRTPSKRELTRLAKKAFGESGRVSIIRYGAAAYDITGIQIGVYNDDAATRRRALEAALRVLAGEEI